LNLLTPLLQCPPFSSIDFLTD